MKKLRLVDLGVIDYNSAIEIMRDIRSEVEHGADDALILMEHTPVVTIGMDSDESSIVDSAYIKKHNIPVVHVDRGGDAVIHNHGQLVMYPVIRIPNAPMDIVESIVNVMADVVSEFGLDVKRKNKPGLWVSDQKIGFIGMRFQHGISIHGIAVNVSNELDPFKAIKTCGVENEKLTNLELSTRRIVSVDEVKRISILKCARRFNYLPDKSILEQNIESNSYEQA